MIFNGKQAEGDKLMAVNLLQHPVTFRGIDRTGSYREVVATHAVQDPYRPGKFTEGVLGYIQHNIKRETTAINSRITSVGLAALVLGETVLFEKIENADSGFKQHIQDAREQAIDSIKQRISELQSE